MQRQDYSNTFGVSQSALKDFRFKSPKSWKNIWIDRQVDLTKKDESFVFGSLVDTLLFSPSEMNDRFYIADVNKIPKGSLEKIVKSVFKGVPTLVGTEFTVEDSELLPEPITKKDYGLGDLKDEILQACIAEDWNAGWKPETRVNKIIEKGTEYFNLLAEAEGKKIITSETNLEGIAMVQSLRKSELVGKYFNDKSSTNRNIYQLELFLNHIDDETLQEVPLKAALDIVHIDYKENTIQIVDFKTSYSAYDFLKSIKQYAYCDQLSFYHFLLSEKLKDAKFRKDFNLKEDVKMLEPINIVIDKEENIPYIYQYNWDDIIISREGNEKFLFELYQTNIHADKIKKGWKTLLKEIAWHMKNDKWDYPREHYELGKIHVNLLNS